MQESGAFPFVGLAIALISVGTYIACFVLAAKTGRLKTVDYLVGTLGLFCGVGWIYFLVRANAVTLQHSFDLIEKGADPAVARELNRRFKIFAGLTIVFGVLAWVVSR